ncbi:phage holin family protein [Porphyromonas sp.]|uniref:phage holin family protein n=1 Tax=Porphyromonas sp. TaxID=1924944 RepID=UPI0026DABF14|nr:phage holin family protein [Porphyromonas sp.]MDO4695806.1 phage holin family protein [Porphyromonas sp.]MDO4771788.1 phage holin family protein [Porphyromonas sp.]
MQKSIHTLIAETKEDINNLIESKIELYKLMAYEKGVPMGLNVAYSVLLVVLLLFVIGMLLTAGALALATVFLQGDASVLTSASLGFLCVGAILLLISILMMLLRNKIVNSQYNKIIGGILDKTPEVINEDTLAIEPPHRHRNIHTQEDHRYE